MARVGSYLDQLRTDGRWTVCAAQRTECRRRLTGVALQSGHDRGLSQIVVGKLLLD
jgi:hypothetical protein